jgi:hypothetical protein
MSMSITSGTKSVKDAAAEIGVTRQCLCRWIKAFYLRCPTGRGKPGRNECRAEKLEDDIFPAGFVWEVPAEEIKRLRGEPKSDGRGRPRGG